MDATPWTDACLNVVDVESQRVLHGVDRPHAARGEQGVDFAEACRLPTVEHHAGARPWAGRGDHDRLRFTRRCRSARTPYPFGRRHHSGEDDAWHIAALVRHLAERDARPTETGPYGKVRRHG